MLIVYVIFGVLMLWLLRLPCLHTTVNTSDIYIYIYIYIRVYGYKGRQKNEEIRCRFVFIRSR